MKDYAALNPEQRAAYNEGLLDAIDRLNGLSQAEPSEIVAAGLRVAACELVLFRNRQIGSAQ